MKVYRQIAGLLLICFSVYLGHNLVPHHHHSELFHSPVTTDCPFGHGDTAADEHPLHCHAFNDVVFEKYTAPVIQPWTSQVLTMLVSSQFLAPEALVIVTSSPFTFLKLLYKSHTVIGTRALRGPPAVA